MVTEAVAQVGQVVRRRRWQMPHLVNQMWGAPSLRSTLTMIRGSRCAVGLSEHPYVMVIRDGPAEGAPAAVNKNPEMGCARCWVETRRVSPQVARRRAGGARNS